MKSLAMCFSRDFEGNEPLAHIGPKLPVYLKLLRQCRERNCVVYVTTRKTYLGGGFFQGAWLFDGQKFEQVWETVKIDLLYDRTGGVKFPLPNDPGMIVVNNLDFKLLCWDKWAAYQQIGEFMPKTWWVGKNRNITSILDQVKTDWVVLKPHNGLKGIGVYVGPKDSASGFEFSEKYSDYIAQEFVDTSDGISGIAEGLHDLRVVTINKKIIWSHVRVPPDGSFKANVAQGGEIRGVPVNDLPVRVREIVQKVAGQFADQYDNPVFSVDFGIGKDGPKVFEINDQMGFPSPGMVAEDDFVKEMTENFTKKLSAKK
jgi:glutathione synthase/RimK-type ligase-like ATP-grasp enzyme